MTILAQRRQFDQMLAKAQAILANRNNYSTLIRQITTAGAAVIYFLKGDRTAALPFVDQARRDREEWRKEKNAIPVLYAFNIAMEARMGNRPEVECEIKDLFDKTRDDKWEVPNSEATAALGYVLMGDLDRALPLLRDALARPSADSVTVSALRLDPNLDNARKDPRFQKLIENP